MERDDVLQDAVDDLLLNSILQLRSTFSTESFRRGVMIQSISVTRNHFRAGIGPFPASTLTTL